MLKNSPYLNQLKLLIIGLEPSTEWILQHSLSNTYSIVGIENNGYVAVDTAFNLAPDLVLLDPDLGNLDGITTIKWIKQGEPNTRVLIFSSKADSDSVRGIMKVGADGYCLKGGSLEQLKFALFVVASGAIYLSSELRESMWCESPSYSARTILTGTQKEPQKKQHKHLPDVRFVAA